MVSEKKRPLSSLLTGAARRKREKDGIKLAELTGELTEEQMRKGWHFCQASADFQLRQVERAWRCYSCDWEVPGRKEGAPLDEEARRRMIVAIDSTPKEDL